MDPRSDIIKRILDSAKEDICPMNDGYFYWFPSKTTGGISAYQLRIIADELDKKNKKVDDAIKDYFSSTDYEI